MRRPLLVLLLGLFACKGDDGPGTSPTPTPMPSPTGATGGATGDTGGTPSTEVLQADLAQSEVVPTVFEARFDSEVGGQGYVEVAGEDGVWWPTERTALGAPPTRCGCWASRPTTTTSGGRWSTPTTASGW